MAPVLLPYGFTMYEFFKAKGTKVPFPELPSGRREDASASLLVARTHGGPRVRTSRSTGHSPRALRTRHPRGHAARSHLHPHRQVLRRGRLRPVGAGGGASTPWAPGKAATACISAETVVFNSNRARSSSLAPVRTRLPLRPKMRTFLAATVAATVPATVAAAVRMTPARDFSTRYQPSPSSL